MLTAHRCLNDKALKDKLSAVDLGVTIGNFDGMHIGHQALFNRLFEITSSYENPFRVLLTLIPHPRRKFSKLNRSQLVEDSNYWHLTSVRQKTLLCESFGFDAILLLHFTKAISQLSPQQFVDQVIVSMLNAESVVVGDDWRFGAGRAGNAKNLEELCAKRGVYTEIVSEVRVNDLRASSSVVRNALRQGDFPKLEVLLGRKFSIYSRIVHGEKRGRQLGYPTANLNIQSQLVPPDGVYSGYAYYNSKKFPAAISLGKKPAIGASFGPNLEAHLIDTPWIDLYGEFIELEFVDFIRAQKKFDTLEELKQQITRDINKIKESLS